MKVLVIGRDPNLFKENSDTFRRVSEYARLFEEYHVISMSEGGFEAGDYGSLKIYPTNSKSVFLRPLDAVRLGIKVVKKHNIDMIDAQDPGESGLTAFLVARRFKIPFRIQIHTDIFSSRYRRAGWKERAWFYIAKFLIPRANCIRVVSERIRKSILGKSDFPREVRLPKVIALPIFTDISIFLNAAPDPAIDARFKDYDFKMVAVGRFLDKEKNFSMLIEMMRDFVKICPKALLVLVGSGPDEKYYKLQTTNYKLDKNVIIEPWRDDLPSFYKSFDLFLLSSNYEGWGRVVIEAMAAGLPVVMTDVGLAGEVVKNEINGLVVPVANRRSFLEAVVNIYKNPEKRSYFSKAGRDTSGGMRPETKEKYLLLYKEGLKKCAS